MIEDKSPAQPRADEEDPRGDSGKKDNCSLYSCHKYNSSSSSLSSYSTESEESETYNRTSEDERKKDIYGLLIFPKSTC